MRNLSVSLSRHHQQTDLSINEMKNSNYLFSLSLLFSLKQIDEFNKFFNNTMSTVKSLKGNLSNTDTMRSSEIEQTIKLCTTIYDEIQRSIKILLDNGE